MNPKTVLGQSIAAGVFLVALAGLDKTTLAGALAIAGLLWALVLNRSYAVTLGDQGRPDRRRQGDRAIAKQLLISYVGPLGAVAVLRATGWDDASGVGPFTGSEVQALLAVTSIMLLVWVASSHVDWYYIRPRIDGVVAEPPCRTSREDRWKGVTRKWYIHRTIASLATMGWAISLALIVTVMLDREWPSAIGTVGGFAAIFSVAVWLMRAEIGSADATHHQIRSPRYWLGDDLYYETDRWKRRGFVLHVAIPVTKLVPLDRRNGGVTSDREPFEETSTELYQARVKPRKFEGCANAGACQKLNRECVHEVAREGVGRGHLLVY